MHVSEGSIHKANHQKSYKLHVNIQKNIHRKGDESDFVIEIKWTTRFGMVHSRSNLPALFIIDDEAGLTLSPIQYFAARFLILIWLRRKMRPYSSDEYDRQLCTLSSILLQFLKLVFHLHTEFIDKSE